MKMNWKLLCATAVLLSSQGLSAATDSVTVTFNVSDTNTIAFSGDPATFTVSVANSPQADTSTTYSVATNQTGPQTISAALDTDMPTGVTLSVDLAAPTGASSNGATSLSSTSATLVTGVVPVNDSSLSVSYSMSADFSAATAGPLTRTITYTLQ